MCNILGKIVLLLACCTMMFGHPQCCCIVMYWHRMNCNLLHLVNHQQWWFPLAPAFIPWFWDFWDWRIWLCSSSIIIYVFLLCSYLSGRGNFNLAVTSKPVGNCINIKWWKWNGNLWGSLHASRKWGQMQDYHRVKVVMVKGRRHSMFI